MPAFLYKVPPAFYGFLLFNILLLIYLLGRKSFLVKLANLHTHRVGHIIKREYVASSLENGTSALSNNLYRDINLSDSGDTPPRVRLPTCSVQIWPWPGKCYAVPLSPPGSFPTCEAQIWPPPRKLSAEQCLDSRAPRHVFALCILTILICSLCVIFCWRPKSVNPRTILKDIVDCVVKRRSNSLNKAEASAHNLSISQDPTAQAGSSPSNPSPGSSNGHGQEDFNTSNLLDHGTPSLVDFAACTALLLPSEELRPGLSLTGDLAQEQRPQAAIGSRVTSPRLHASVTSSRMTDGHLTSPSPSNDVEQASWFTQPLLPAITPADGLFGEVALTEVGVSTRYVPVEKSTFASTIADLAAGMEASVLQPSIRRRVPEGARATEQHLFPSTTLDSRLTLGNNTLTESRPQTTRIRPHSAPHRYRPDVHLNQRRSTRRHARNPQVQPVRGHASDSQASRLHMQTGHVPFPLSITINTGSSESSHSTMGVQISWSQLPSAPANSSVHQRPGSVDSQISSTVPTESEAPEVSTWVEHTSIPVTVTVVDTGEDTSEQRFPRHQIEEPDAHSKENMSAFRGAQVVPRQSIQPLRDAIRRHLGLSGPRCASRHTEPVDDFPFLSGVAHLQGIQEHIGTKNTSDTKLAVRAPTTLQSPANGVDYDCQTSSSGFSFGSCDDVEAPEVGDVRGEASNSSVTEIETSSSILRAVDTDLNASAKLVHMNRRLIVSQTSSNPPVSLRVPPVSTLENIAFKTQESRLGRPHSFSYSEYQYDSPLTSQRGLLGSFLPIYDEPYTASSVGPRTLPSSSGTPSQLRTHRFASSASQSLPDVPLTTWELEPMVFGKTTEEILSYGNAEVLSSNSEVEITSRSRGTGSLTSVAGNTEDIPFLVAPPKVLDRTRRSSGIPVPSQHNEGEMSFVAGGILNLSP